MLINKIAESIGEVYGHIKNIFDGQKELIRLNIVERGAKLSSMFIIAMIFMLVVFLILLMLCMALATFLYVVFDSMSLAFLGTAGILILFLLIIYIFRNTLVKRPVLNKIIRYIDKR